MLATAGYGFGKLLDGLSHQGEAMHQLICLLFLLAMPLPATDDAREELKSLQGTWQAVALEAMGNPFPKDRVPPFTIVIGTDGKCTGKMGQSEFSFTMTINPRKNPKTIENQHHSGPDKGKKQYGIYKLEGDTFTVCMTPGGAPADKRPKDFNTKGTNNVVFVFERVKAEK